jgi:hypothetical protein
MQNDPVSDVPSSRVDAWTWIMLAILLALGVLIGLGGLALTHWNQQMETPTGSQTVPTRR